MIHDSVEQGRNGADESGFYLNYLVEHVVEITRVWYQRDRVVIDERETLEPSIAVSVKEGQRQHDRVGPLLHCGTKPRLELKSRDHHSTVGSNYSFRRSGSTAAHQNHRRML